VGRATLDVLERHGLEVDFPRDQTCCGQPMYNAGFSDEARTLARRHVRIFREYEHVVCPSASCVATVRHGYASLVPKEPGFEDVRASTRELCEFLTDVLGVTSVPGRFPHRVGLHASCHGVRELRLAGASELGASAPGARPTLDRAHRLLASIDGIELVSPRRPDECCGFGGTFAVDEPAVAAMMGRDRIADHARAGAEIVTATDVSCLAHLDGLMRHDGSPLRVMHVAEILAAAGAEAGSTA